MSKDTLKRDGVRRLPAVVLAVLAALTATTGANCALYLAKVPLVVPMRGNEAQDHRDNNNDANC